MLFNDVDLRSANNKIHVAQSNSMQISDYHRLCCSDKHQLITKQ